jgi:membrane peptidoglycan carboxypeptidase
MVLAELRERDPGGPDPAKAGYRITTTFDKKMIDQAVASVHDVLGPRSTWTKDTQVGLVSLDPTTGEVKAIYGGDGKTRFQNAATQDAPQAGSTMKPFTLLAALESGISLDSRFSGRNPYIYKSGPAAGQKVNNFDGESFGMVDLKTATAHSVNTVYAALNDKIGDGSGTKTKQAAERAGIPPGIVTDEVSNVLGNASAHVIDMASAYGTIAARGVYVKPHVIREIKNAGGGVVDGRKFPAERKFSADVTADACYAMQQVIKGGTGNYAQRLNRPVAGKTGTVGSKTGRETKAAWFVGFTPQLSTAVAMHRVGKGTSRADVVGWGPFKNENLQGGMFPVRVWTDFMGSALKGKPETQFPPPSHVGTAFDPAPPAATTTTSTDTTSPTTDGQPTDPNAPGSPSPTGPATGDPSAPPTDSPPGNGQPGAPTTTASS